MAPPQIEPSTGTLSVLFISHETTRSGASILLLELLRWLTANTRIRPEIMALQGGPLQDEFRSVAPLRIVGVGRTDRPSFLIALSGRFRDHRFAALRLVSRAAKRIWRSRRKRDLASVGKYDLIYANGAASASLFVFLPRNRPAIVAHIHELEYALRVGISEEALGRLLGLTEHFVACSGKVEENLVTNHRVPPEMVDVHHSFINVDNVTKDADQSSREEVLEELGIPAGAVVVGGSGSRDWHKGTDLFIQTAAAVRHRAPEAPAYFVWVGGISRGPEYGALMHDIQEFGLQDHVRLVDDNPNPHRYFNAFDIFALTSRVEALGMVCLEAAALGKPIVSFASGGITELVEDDAGRVVEYGDVPALADSVVELMSDEELRHRLGKRGAEKVATRHEVSIVAPRIAEVIERFAKR